MSEAPRDYLFKNKRTPWADILCVAVIMALAAAYIWPALSGERAFGPYDLLKSQYPWGASLHSRERPANPEAQDFVHQFYPWREFYSRSLRNGDVPLWNPHQFCGTPFAANDQSAVYYPLNLLYVIMPVWRAFGVSAFIHLFLAGLFMFLFVRVIGVVRGAALVAAAAFMFTGWNVLWMSHASKFDAAAWTPLVFLFYELSLRKKGLRPLLFTTAALGMQFTAGFLQAGLYTVYGLLIYGAVRSALKNQPQPVTLTRAASALLLPCAAAAALAAVHIIPVLELAAISQRSIIHHHFGMFPGIPFKWLVTIFLPNVLGNPTLSSTTQPINYTENCCYAGLSVFILAVFAMASWKFTTRGRPQIPALALAAVVGLVSALGTPLYLFFYYLMPGAKTLAVNRIVFLFCFGISALCGLGASAILDFIRKTELKKYSAVASILLFGIVAVELFCWARGFNPSMQRSFVFPVTPALGFLRERADESPPFRVQATTWDPESGGFHGVNLFPNTASVFGLDDFRGYDSLFPKRYQEFIRRVHEQSQNAPFKESTSVTTQTTVSPWLNFMNVEYLLAVYPPIPGTGWTGAFFQPGDVAVYRNTRVLPRASVYKRWRVIKTKDNVLNAVMAMNPANEVILEQPPRGLSKSLTSRNSVGEITKNNVIIFGNDPIKLTAHGPGILVISNSWAEGWHAYEQGRPLPVMRANYVFSAIPLEKNRNYTISIKYEPYSAKIGLLVSCLFLTALLVAVIAVRQLGDNGI